MTSVVFFYQVFGVHVLLWLPCVIRRWIPLPFDQVLELTSASVMSVVNDVFYLVLFLASDQIRRWSFEVWAMRGGLLIG